MLALAQHESAAPSAGQKTEAAQAIDGWAVGGRRHPGHKPGPAIVNHWALCYGKVSEVCS